jgi:hypothetical protein
MSDKLLDEAADFPVLGVAVVGKLGVDQVAVDGDLIAAPIRGDEGNRFDVFLVLVEQFGGQTGRPWGVVSDRAVFDRNFEQHGRLRKVDFDNYIIGRDFYFGSAGRMVKQAKWRLSLLQQAWAW